MNERPLEVESLVLVFMLTWAPVELNNFCNVIGVTKEGFLVLYTCIWMILLTETYRGSHIRLYTLVSIEPH